MKKAILIVSILFMAVVSTACINNFAVQELNNKAKISLENGDYETAISRLQSSIDLDSSIFETHYNLGIAYIKAKQYQKAIESLNKAIELNPKFTDVYYSLAVAQDSWAQELLDEDTNIKNSDDAEETPKLSKEQRKMMAFENYTNAIASYKKYLELDPNNKDADAILEQIKSIEEELAK